MTNTNESTVQIADVQRLFRPQDVATILNISRSFTYALMQTGQLPTVRLGRSVRVKPEDLRAFIEKNTTSGYSNF